MLVRVRAAGAGDVRVIAAKDQRIYFNCGCVLRVRAEYELALRRSPFYLHNESLV